MTEPLSCHCSFRVCLLGEISYVVFMSRREKPQTCRGFLSDKVRQGPRECLCFHWGCLICLGHINTSGTQAEKVILLTKGLNILCVNPLLLVSGEAAFCCVWLISNADVIKKKADNIFTIYQACRVCIKCVWPTHKQTITNGCFTSTTL